MKKTWTRPELVVLVRGSEEERVLGSCKSFEQVSGPSYHEDACDRVDGCMEICSDFGGS